MPRNVLGLGLPSGSIFSVPGLGIMYAIGDTVPADAVAGYGRGCIFLQKDVTTDIVYVNIGSKTSANFDPMASASGIIDAGSFTAQTTIEGALQEMYQHLFSATGGYIDLPLTSWREIDSSGDVGNAAANGGLLASDTTPIARGDSNEAMEIAWATGDVDNIGINVGCPPDFDGTAQCKVDLFVKGGTTNAPTFTVNSTWDGATQIVDTATGSASATLHTATATIAAADIPDAPSSLTLQLIPGTHGTDAFLLLGARLTYKRKLLTS